MNDQKAAAAPTMSTKKQTSRMWRRVGLAVGAGVVLSSCARNAPQDSWAPSGEYAQMIHDLQWPIFLLAGIVGVIVYVIVAIALWRFRDHGQPIPDQGHGKAWIEYLFIALPALILASIAVPTVSTVLALEDTDNPDCVINVTGQQWWWEYDYPVAPDGSICGFMPNEASAPIIVSGQMIIPTDAKVVIRGTSRDVIHSFWVPKLNGKRDMVPGRIHSWNFEAERPGIFAGQCAEFCGLSHANMRMEIVALDPPDFQAWLDNQLEPYVAMADREGVSDLAIAGEATFIQQCSRCHQVDGLTDADGNIVISSPEDFVYSGSAPNLTNLMTRNTFAGATWDLVTPECRDRTWEADPQEFGAIYLEGVTESCFNEVDLKEWLRNAPEKKPMYADADKLGPTDEKTRGMPALGLSEDQINELVAYLLELK